MPLPNLLSEILAWLYRVFASPVWEGIGTVFAILVVVAPWLIGRIASVNFRQKALSWFWWSCIPLLIVLVALSGWSGPSVLVIVLSMAAVVLWIVRESHTRAMHRQLTMTQRELVEAQKQLADRIGESPYAVIKSR